MREHSIQISGTEEFDVPSHGARKALQREKQELLCEACLLVDVMNSCNKVLSNIEHF